MYIVILPEECVIERNLKRINKIMSAQFEESNFHTLGNHKICDCRREDYEFVQDKKIMSSIPMKLLYKKDNTLLYVMIANLLLSFILLAKGG